MMKFRRIYWVTEQLGKDGASEVTGVYTSIPDLIDTGLGVRELGTKRGFRISLCELDSAKPPLLCFSSPEFGGLEDALSPFVDSDELTYEDVCRLLEALHHSCK